MILLDRIGDCNYLTHIPISIACLVKHVSTKTLCSRTETVFYQSLRKLKIQFPLYDTNTLETLNLPGWEVWVTQYPFYIVIGPSTVIPLSEYWAKQKWFFSFSVFLSSFYSSCIISTTFICLLAILYTSLVYHVLPHVKISIIRMHFSNVCLSFKLPTLDSLRSWDILSFNLRTFFFFSLLTT